MKDAVPPVSRQVSYPVERSCERSGEIVAILAENLPDFPRRSI